VALRPRAPPARGAPRGGGPGERLHPVREIIEPDDGLLAIGSGGPYALSAARALLKETKLSAAEIVRKSLEIAGEICIFTNTNITVIEPVP